MRAAEYLRMSTEHQQYSIERQTAAIAAYAVTNGFQVVKTYADPARSGLDLAHRPGLQQLLQDVVGGRADYDSILVYDISRWGRFQDTDESAFYEFWCKRAGVKVYYCAEPFSNTDQTITATLLKAVKRAMAGEYLRELSVRVHAGQCRVAMHGYKLGGVAGYGLRRLLISRDGTPKSLMEKGERKGFASDRVVYVPGPPEELAVVRQIYSWYLDDHISIPSIAKLLNEKRILRDGERIWDHYCIRKILTHPKYTGCVVFNQTSRKLLARTSTRNPREDWIVTPNSFEPIIPKAIFEAVQRRMRKPHCKSDSELLDELRDLLGRRGRLSVPLIQADCNTGGVTSYKRRFGTLANAYKLLGYEAEQGRFRGPETRKRLDSIKRTLKQELVAGLRANALQARETRMGVRLSGLCHVRLEIGECYRVGGGGLRWDLRMRNLHPRKPILFVRLTEDNQSILDFVLMDKPPRVKHLARMSEQSIHDHTLFADIAGAISELMARKQNRGKR